MQGQVRLQEILYASKQPTPWPSCEHPIYALGPTANRRRSPGDPGAREDSCIDQRNGVLDQYYFEPRRQIYARVGNRTNSLHSLDDGELVFHHVGRSVVDAGDLGWIGTL